MARTAETPNFESILDMPSENVERPKPLPVGTYNAIVQGLYEEGVSSQKRTPFVQFAFAIQSADEDVDEDDLNTYLTAKDGTRKSLQGITLKNNSTKFYTTPDSLFRLTDFLDICGVPEEGMTIRQRLSETPNCGVKIQIGHVASQDGESVFAEVKKILPAD
jgi:hypothetical protein